MAPISGGAGGRGSVPPSPPGSVVSRLGGGAESQAAEPSRLGGVREGAGSRVQSKPAGCRATGLTTGLLSALCGARGPGGRDELRPLRLPLDDGEAFSRPEEGTVQGSALSPLLGNVYLHQALGRGTGRGYSTPGPVGGRRRSRVTLQDLGSLGEIIGAAGVIASLIYVALQIRQNTNAVVAGTHQALFESWSGLSASLTDNPEVSRLVLKAADGYQELAPDERMRFEAFATRLLGQFENVFLQHQRGLVPEETWPHWEAYYRDQLAPECFAHYWARARPWYFPDFQIYADQLFQIDAVAE